MYQTRRVPYTNKENYGDKRTFRAEEKAKNRRVSRQRDFYTHRNITTELVQAVEQEPKDVYLEPKVLSRAEMLKRWKQEKDKLKKAEKEKKAKEKPPFKCGKVHHGPPPVLGAECRRSARVKNNLKSKEVVNVVNSNEDNVTSRRKSKFSFSVNRSFQSFAPVAHQFKPPVNLPKIEENSMSPAPDATGWSDFSMVFPAQLSPWISKGRGSESEKKSPKAAEGMSDETPRSNKKALSAVKVADLNKCTPDALRVSLGKRLFEKSLKTPEVPEKVVKKCTPRPSTPALSKEDAARLEDFRSLYDGEMSRLHGLCSQWDSVMSSETCLEMPVDVQDSVHAAVGQTRLLMKEKLGQFNDLLQQFQTKTSKSSPVITSSDLQGFWDLVSIQINDVDAKFNSLDALRWNNWVAVEPKANTEKSVFRRRNMIISNTKNKKPVAAKSSFKAYIAEQRRKLEEATSEPMLKENEGSVKKGKAKGIRTPLLTKQNSVNTPTSILKGKSSRPRSSKAGLREKDHNVTPRRSSRRVMFADDTICDDRPKLLVVKSPYVSASEKDLISWDSPSNEFPRPGLRSSSRLSRDNKD